MQTATVSDTEQRECTDHGQYQSHRFFGQHWSNCPHCSEEQDIARRLESETRQRKERQEKMLRRSGIAGRFEGARFENFRAVTAAQEEVLRAAENFVSCFECHQGGGMWLIGRPGTGKTHLGCAMVRGVIESYGMPASICSARGIVRRLRASWRKGATETEEDAIEEYSSDALLVIDEVGNGFGTEGEQLQLFDVVDLRYQYRCPTVLLSNLNVPLLRVALGERVFDRLREGVRVLTCDWASHRAGVRGDRAVPSLPPG
ncbi:ATP-binding protein [Ramlibacter monticola]|uniref:ATP-binding protein n=1 Tax=Ramlibacter monticola TaxID=1926872 RepID=A0A936Z4N1_9BURK|nr:ATP-binding protein [Ramlibacter monticola]MBL0394272.1 ATP-binding protein [Ramlibacter monticola]